jgi:hypothetical protein
MNAVAVLEQAQASGVKLSATPGGNLRWRCIGGLPADLRNGLVARKAQILELIQFASRKKDVELDDIIELFNERAGIMQYEAKLTRERAEARALEDVFRMVRRTCMNRTGDA